MRIKDVCKNYLSDHYMLTPGTIKQLGISINGSTIEAYMHAQPQEIHSFIKCVLPKHHKQNAPIIKNQIVQKRKHNQVVKYEDIFYEPKFREIVQRIYNAIFVSVCQICLTRTKRPGKNSTWINDLNHEHQKNYQRQSTKCKLFHLALRELNSQNLMTTKVIGGI